MSSIIQKHRRGFFSLFSLVAFLLLGNLILPAWANRDRSNSRNCIKLMAWSKMREGYRLRNMDTNRLAEGTGTLYSMTLFADESYYFLACGAKGKVKDINLYLYDTKGGLVKQDQDNNRSTVLKFEPSKTGAYRVVVGLVDGGGYYTFAVLTKLDW